MRKQRGDGWDRMVVSHPPAHVVPTASAARRVWSPPGLARPASFRFHLRLPLVLNALARKPIPSQP